MILVTLLSSGPARLRAEEDEVVSLTVDQALELLHRQNPELLAGALKIGAVAGDVTTARLLPNPGFSATLGNMPIGKTNPPGTGFGNTVNEQFGLQEELVLWGKRGAHIAAAQAHAAQAWADRADLDRRLTFELRSRFVAVLVTTERLRLARENLTQYRDTVRISRLRADTGEIAPAEFDKIALEQRSFEKEVDDAEADRREAVAALLPLLGLSAADVAVAGDLALPPARTDVQALIQEALDRRPDLRAADRATEAADAGLRAARTERWPNVTVGVVYTHDEFQVSGNLGNSIGTNFSLPLPLLNQNQGAIQRAAAEALIARHERDKLRLEIPQEVRTAVQTYARASARVGRYESGYLDQAREARHAAEVSYQQGAVSLLEFLDAERAYRQTQRDYLDAILNGQTAAFDLTRAAALEVAR